MSKDQEEQKLEPADIPEILEEFSHLLGNYENLNERNSVYSNYYRRIKRVEVLFPLKEHPIHGKTGLLAIEKYDDAGYVERYNYIWKRILPKTGINTAHISSWGNDSHNADGTADIFKVETEPHHHHHDPNDKAKRKENYSVRTLRQAFLFIGEYINTNKEYTVDSTELKKPS